MDVLSFIDLVTQVFGRVDKNLTVNPEHFFKHTGRELEERGCLAIFVKTRSMLEKIADQLSQEGIEFKSEAFQKGVIIYFPKTRWDSVAEEVCGSFKIGA